ncbi:ATP-binding protein [Streptomyces anthocyanicus]|uniref:ATP-binding protein n=1 Tax=Streptomyces anthocyanicus TaxID=68174 RepID=UPI0033BA0BA4
MLYGRSSEVSALDEVIAQARHGCGGAVVLRGEAGAGKTALLDAAAARGEAMRVLRTGGVESESDLAFAALHQLLWPVAGLLDALPAPQRDAVRAALGHVAGGAGDRFLLGAGVLSLLAEAAGPEGLICVVDDFQWVDRASADVAVRRQAVGRRTDRDGARCPRRRSGQGRDVDGGRARPARGCRGRAVGIQARDAGRPGERRTHQADRVEPSGPE